MGSGPEHTPAAKPLCVVINTSVWRAEPLLKTPMGTALVYDLSRRGGFVGLPEVVELELESQIVLAGQESLEKVRGPLHLLATLSGNLFLTTLPTQEVFVQQLAQRLKELETVIVRERFTESHARAALAMVNAKLPPNGEKNQQFKDSAIWQAVLALGAKYTIKLVTTDKAFFRDREPTKGLAENLVADCEKATIEVLGYDDIASVLTELKSVEPQYDRERVKQLVTALAAPSITIQAAHVGVKPTTLLDCQLVAFPTQDEDCIAIDYTLRFDVEPLIVDKRMNWPDRATVHGSEYFAPRTGNLTGHFIQLVDVRGPTMSSARSFPDYDEAFPVSRPLPQN